ncbi:MAG: hypothetical protein WBP76_07580 [Leptotrichiaceae bacterium]|nr:hypothetical protein [Leptotrichiaceae bacterium]MBP8637229.1 hypothetical protein [Leptotrichiaceae bacterium]MBP9876553.1 hypothetical protein [Leptotrichiaceae bacterium]
MAKEIKKLSKERYLLLFMLLSGSYILLVTKIYSSALVLLLFICMMIYFSILVSNMLLQKQRSKLIMTAFILIDNLIFFQSRLSGISIYMYLLGLLAVWFFIRKDEFENAVRVLSRYTGIKIVFIILLITVSARIV